MLNIGHRIGLVIALAVWGASAAAQDDDSKPTADQIRARLQGTWQPETAIFGGNPLPKEVLEGMRMTIAEMKYHVKVNEVDDKGNIELSMADQPWKMTLIGVEGPNAESKIPAIFKFTGEKLLICYNLELQGTPAEFESEPNTQLLLITFVRVKDD